MMAMQEGGGMGEVLDWIGISGLIAMVASAVGYGQLHGRVKSLEDKDTSQENQVAIARLEEQVKAMRSDVSDIKKAVTR